MYRQQAYTSKTTYIEESSSSSSESDDEYKCIIPKCNNKYNVGSKKKNWKKIFTKDLVIDGFNFVVKTIAGIAVIGYIKNNSDKFNPIGNIAFGSYNFTTPQFQAKIFPKTYIPFASVSNYNLTFTQELVGIGGSIITILIPGYYQINFSILLENTSSGVISVYVNGAGLTPLIYDYHCDLSLGMSGTLIIPLNQKDTIGLFNSAAINNSGANDITLASNGTNLTINYIGSLSPN